MSKRRIKSRVYTCVVCGAQYHPWKRTSETCSSVCRNTHTARKTVDKRGNILRGRGAGKTYTKLGGRHMHRVIAELKLGRPLLPGEIVHHKDENKKNNHPDNLEVVATQAEHMRHHNPSQFRKFEKKPPRYCGVDGCGRLHRAKGLCGMHYQRMKGGLNARSDAA